VSLYLRDPRVDRAQIEVYPKRRNDSYFTLGLPTDERPTRSARQESPATDPSYADFFRRSVVDSLPVSGVA
jgi:hypothetical protein